MSFNRLNYDKCESKIAIKESVGPGLYQVNTPVLCNTCFQDNPQIISQKGGVSMNANKDWRFYAGPIDVESELMNINRPATKCPTGKYEPKCPKCGIVVSGQPCGQGVAYVCFQCGINIPRGGMCNEDLVNLPDCHFPVENTRLSNPPSTLRGTGWNRFDPLCLDPQDQIFFPGEYHIPTRMVFRDNFRPCLREVKINSMHPEDLNIVMNNRKKCEKIGINNNMYATPKFIREKKC
jgi:hypothetical protein